jgi:uncharacterized protein (TIGR03435 family)
MSELDDHQLLEQFARGQSDQAFTALVARHVNLVYSTALRFTANPHHAEEVTQAVFIILARKAVNLSPRIVLSGWLYQAARLTASNFVKREIRRQHREQEAFMQSTANETDSGAWQQIAPLLDEAMGRLGEADRNAVVLRFFENKTAAEVAVTLKTTEAAAHKRVSRALEKLRKFFTKRGVTLSAALIAGTVSANSVHAAPVGIIGGICAAAGKGAALGTSTSTLVKGVLKLMAMTKVKLAVAVTMGVLLAAGTTTVAVKTIEKHQNEGWQLGQLDSTFLLMPPYRTEILPTRSGERSFKLGDGGMVLMLDGRAYGLKATVEDMLRIAYSESGSVSRPRMLFEAEIPANNYDFFSNLPKGSRESLQQEIRKQFRLSGRFETIETNVLFLRVKHLNAAGLKPSRSKKGSTSEGNGSIQDVNASMDDLARSIENLFKIPVANQTGLRGAFDFKISWDDYAGGYPNLNGFKQALTEQLGLELTEGTAPIEMLVIEKAK